MPLNDREQKFTVQDVEEALQQARTYYARRDKEVKKDVELYNQDYTLDMPKDFHQIKTPTTKTMCDRPADRLGSGRMQVHIEPRRAGAKERRHVEALERAATVLPYMMRKRVKYNPIRGAALHHFNRGAAVFKVQVDINAANSMPNIKDYGTARAFTAAKKLWQLRNISSFPVVLDVRPIEAIYPDTESDGENYVIENYRRRVGDIKKNYPHWDGWRDLLSKKKSQYRKQSEYTDDLQVEYTEIWTPNYRAVMVEKQFINIGRFEPGPVPNLLGRVPYFLRYAGFGDPAGEPHQRCVSILRGIRDTSRSMSRLFSIIDTVAENEAYGAVLYKKGDSGGEDFEIGPGAKNAMDFPELVKPYQAQGVNPSLLSALGAINAANEYGSVAAEAIGQPPPGGRGPFPMSGVAAAIQGGSASMILDPVKSAIQDALEDIIPFTFYIFDQVIDTEFPLYGQVGENQFVQLSLGPADVDSHYGPVFVELKMRAPEDDYAKYQLGIQAMQAGFPPEFVMEKFFGIENAESVVREMMARQIAYSPTVREQYLIPRMLERLKAQNSGSADVLPGQRTPAPATFALPPNGMPVGPDGMPVGPDGMPMGPNGVPAAANGMGGTPVALEPPADAMVRAAMGMTTPAGPMGTPPVVTRQV